MRYVRVFIVVVLSASAPSLLHAQSNEHRVRVSEWRGEHKNAKDHKNPKNIKNSKDNKDPKSVPEPATLLLMGAAAGLAGIRKLRQRRNAR